MIKDISFIGGEMVNVFSKNKLTYLGSRNDICIYAEKTYALVHTDQFGKDTLKVYYKGSEVNWAILVTGPIDRIEEVNREVL